MKAVLISIQPKWVEKIVSGKKTIEVRKTKPNLQTPFKCYIYMTKAKPYWFEFVGGGKMQARNGMVIGEFVCRGMMDGGSSLLPKQSCLTLDEILDYAKGKRVYGWRIADLKIYDKPKELSEFEKPCNFKWECSLCERYDRREHKCYKAIKSPPQSWCYVEELKEMQNG